MIKHFAPRNNIVLKLCFGFVFKEFSSVLNRFGQYLSFSLKPLKGAVNYGSGLCVSTLQLCKTQFRTECLGCGDHCRSSSLASQPTNNLIFA